MRLVVTPSPRHPVITATSTTLQFVANHSTITA